MKQSKFKRILSLLLAVIFAFTVFSALYITASAGPALVAATLVVLKGAIAGLVAALTYHTVMEIPKAIDGALHLLSFIDFLDNNPSTVLASSGWVGYDSTNFGGSLSFYLNTDYKFNCPEEEYVANELIKFIRKLESETREGLVREGFLQ